MSDAWNDFRQSYVKYKKRKLSQFEHSHAVIREDDPREVYKTRDKRVKTHEKFHDRNVKRIEACENNMMKQKCGEVLTLVDDDDDDCVIEEVRISNAPAPCSSIKAKRAPRRCRRVGKRRRPLFVISFLRRFQSLFLLGLMIRDTFESAQWKARRMQIISALYM